ncbi:MAG: response regulator [Anaerolineae bacterium]|nr:response regulator [Anaerolineae bacterium]
MRPDKSSSRLLVIDGDDKLVLTLRRHFEDEGYQVYMALTGEEGLSLAQSARPHLVLLAFRLPDMAGMEVLRTLRDKPRTGHIPVMILASHSEAMLQNQVLEEGAYDFLEKPLDLDIVALRVRNALRRAEREGLTEPRTGLPTGRLIQERVRALSDELGWYKIDLRIEGFNDFRDLYGFVTANEALRFAGNLIPQVVNQHGSPDDFVGHTNGTEEFVIITSLANGPTLAKVLHERVSRELQSFYNFMEREQGYVLVEDGSGGTVKKPLMSAQVQVAEGDPDPNGVSPAPPTQSEDAWVDAVDSEESGSDSGSAFEW